MAKEKGPVADFVQTRKRINDYFGCEGDFFIHPLLDFEWAVREDEIGFIFRNGKNQTQQ